jgi:hypothetical protein
MRATAHLHPSDQSVSALSNALLLLNRSAISDLCGRLVLLCLRGSQLDVLQVPLRHLCL